MSLYYDQEGKPITLMQWVAAFEDGEKRIVEKTVVVHGKTVTGASLKEVIDGVEVSTVWLGLNSGFSMDCPLIFETMVFGGDDDGYQERYATKDEAISGHWYICEQLMLGLRLQYEGDEYRHIPREDNGE